MAAAAACTAAPGLGPTGRIGPHRRRQALRSAIVGGGISLCSWPEWRGWLVRIPGYVGAGAGRRGRAALCAHRLGPALVGQHSPHHRGPARRCHASPGRLPALHPGQGEGRRAARGPGSVVRSGRRLPGA